MSLDDALEEVADEAGRQVAEQFREIAIQNLRDIGGRLDYDVDPIINSATPVTKQGDSYTFSFTHPASAILEFGSDPHEITPSDPDGVLVWEKDGETFYAKSVNHPGTEAILFVSKSQQRITEGQARDLLSQ
jgi:hypothetical protein